MGRMREREECELGEREKGRNVSGENWREREGGVSGERERERGSVSGEKLREREV